MSTNNKNAELEALTKSLVDIVIESWRFERLFDRLLLKLDSGEQVRYRGQIRWFHRKLEESLNDAGMAIVNLEGCEFDVGMAATSLNIEEFESEDTLVVDQMIEPIIMGTDGVIIRSGIITVRKTG